jgi:hypothetical protein
MFAGGQRKVGQGKDLFDNEATHMTRASRAKAIRYEQLRRPLPKSALALQPETIAWARSLPFDVLPKSLLTDFPRIANQLASHSHSPHLFRQQLQALMLNDRPGRRGFPFRIVKELADLQAYFNDRCAAFHDEEWRSMVER